ncbi:MAG: hypothetical protein ACFFFG_14590 [Candidatus Thorarchaeota archaeon]
MQTSVDLTKIARLSDDGSWLTLQVGQYDPSDESQFVWGDTPYPLISLKGLKHPPYNKVRNISLMYSGVTQLSELEALGSCRDLEYFEILGDNPLTEFDVSVLRECKHIKGFNLSNSRIDTFDFSIVQSWPALVEFAFDYNRVQTVDLTPFSHHPSLQSFSLAANQLVELDISPLFSCPKLTRINLHSLQGYVVPVTLKEVSVPNPPPPQANPFLEILMPSVTEYNGQPDHYHRVTDTITDLVTFSLSS